MVAHSHRFTTAQSLHAQLVDAVRTSRLADATVARLLLEVRAGKLYTELGYASLSEYADRELDLRPRKTRALVFIASKLDQLPSFADAVTSGVLSWTKAREIARIAIPSTEAEWVKHAQTATNRELETLATVGLPGDTVVRAESKRDDQPDVRTLVFKNVPSDLADLIEDALALRIQQSSNGADPSYLATDRAEALAVMAQRMLFEADGADAPSAERFRIVMQECPTCAGITTESGSVDETHAGMATCCGDVVDLSSPRGAESSEPVEKPSGPRGPKRAGENGASSSKPSGPRGTRRSTIPPRIRRAVLHRDGRRCVVENCANRLWIDLHHVIPQAQGGGHTEDNLVTLCSQHHHLVHDGRMALDGSLPMTRAVIGGSANSRMQPRVGM